MVTKKPDPKPSDPIEHIDTESPYPYQSYPRGTEDWSSPATGWFVGIIVALALLAIGYLVFAAVPGPIQTEVTAPPAASSDSAVGVKQ